MSIGWYLNHSEEPNVRIVGHRGRSLRAIGAGEELTVDYHAL
jgi:SET domain-containing protein